MGERTWSCVLVVSARGRGGCRAWGDVAYADSADIEDNGLNGGAAGGHCVGEDYWDIRESWELLKTFCVERGR